MKPRKEIAALSFRIRPGLRVQEVRNNARQYPPLNNRRIIILGPSMHLLLIFQARNLLSAMQVDREGANQERCSTVESDVFDLFAQMGASDEQLDFPVLYASGRQASLLSCPFDVLQAHEQDCPLENLRESPWEGPQMLHLEFPAMSQFLEIVCKAFVVHGFCLLGPMNSVLFRAWFNIEYVSGLGKPESSSIWSRTR